MSIRERLDDARILFAKGRRDGALLSVLIAVAATSRRRYPYASTKMRDGDAFIRFLLDEHPAVIKFSDWVPTCERDYIGCICPDKVLDDEGNRVGGLWLKVPGSAQWGWPDEMMPLATCLYKYVRNSLAHEGLLPSNVEFVDTGAGHLTFEVLDDRIRISNTLMDGLGDAVMYAPENFDLFPDISATPTDVIA